MPPYFWSCHQWDHFLSLHLELHGRSDYLVNIGSGLDCINPTEPTYKYWTSMILVAHFDNTNLQQMSLTSKYALLDYVKTQHKKIAKNKFGFDDFLSQIQQIKKMGNMKDLMGMIPGAGKALKGLDIDDDAFKHIEAIIYSMTPDERSTPSKLNASRKKRIAKGSGREVQEINQLLKQEI